MSYKLNAGVVGLFLWKQWKHGNCWIIEFSQNRKKYSRINKTACRFETELCCRRPEKKTKLVKLTDSAALTINEAVTLSFSSSFAAVLLIETYNKSWFPSSPVCTSSYGVPSPAERTAAALPAGFGNMDVDFYPIYYHAVIQLDLFSLLDFLVLRVL